MIAIGLAASRTAFLTRAGVMLGERLGMIVHRAALSLGDFADR